MKQTFNIGFRHILRARKRQLLAIVWGLRFFIHCSLSNTVSAMNQASWTTWESLLRLRALLNRCIHTLYNASHGTSNLQLIGSWLFLSAGDREQAFENERFKRS